MNAHILVLEFLYKFHFWITGIKISTDILNNQPRGKLYTKFLTKNY